MSFFGGLISGFLDPFGITGLFKTSSPSITPQEQQAYTLGEKYLKQYQSGQLTPGDQASVDLAAKNQQAAGLQSFANAGMLGSTAVPELQTGIDLQKATNTQTLLSSYLQNSMAYLGVASGDAAALSSLNLQANQQVIGLIGSASQALGNLYGSGDNLGSFQGYSPGPLPNTASVPVSPGSGDELTLNLPGG